ncbi:DUF2381 family protein [Archangium violaceum]|uniref:DUF2381 family protein n=1 Tax=Archangium violaceum Cb vi76 TaxID=1406225 RepID=A0A084SZ29_9BACT|nr:DUF2381 family protein [Archangium violaceum]KFA93714.1 hypothetical protein Q664_07395 [Archangium violaceum Cb vi76]
MRPGPWFFLLALLLSAPASARERQEASVFRQRTLLVSSQPDGVPPLELHVAAGTATLVESDVPLGPLSFQDVRGRIQLVPIDDHRLVLVPSEDLTQGERLPFVVGATPRAGPLRFSLVTRRDEVDTSVLLVRASPAAADEDAARALVLQLLSAPEARATFAVPQEIGKLAGPESRVRLVSLLRLGQRLFVTLAVGTLQPGLRPWRPRQLRLRATIGRGPSFVEWPVPFLSGPLEKKKQQFHVLTALLPEGTTRLEVALDGEHVPGAFHVLPLEAAVELP